MQKSSFIICWCILADSLFHKYLGLYTLNISFDLSLLLLPVINESFIAVIESKLLNQKFTVLFYTPQATLTTNLYMMEY